MHDRSAVGACYMAFSIPRPGGVVVDAMGVEGECGEAEEEGEAGRVDEGYIEGGLREIG